MAPAGRLIGPPQQASNAEEEEEMKESWLLPEEEFRKRPAEKRGLHQVLQDPLPRPAAWNVFHSEAEPLMLIQRGVLVGSEPKRPLW